VPVDGSPVPALAPGVILSGGHINRRDGDMGRATRVTVAWWQERAKSGPAPQLRVREE